MKRIKGQKGHLMGMDYVRVMPQPQLQTVGSFFFLDHFYEREITPKELSDSRGTGAHPHRGITTVTYVIKGENEHKDSLGNRAIVTSGGMQWMKAGRGIIHDEGVPESFLKRGGPMHMMQFWVLLGENEREDAALYLPVPHDDIPQLELDKAGSVLKVLIGEFCVSKSKVKTGKPHFLFHLSLQGKQVFYYTLPENTELAILAAKGSVEVQNEELTQSDLFAFGEVDETIKLYNPSDETVEIMLFGGEPFGERFYSHGPFVMGDREGIATAYNDLYAGKYGEVL